MSTPKQKIGFIGLGVMGKPMAKNLMRAGHALIFLSRRRAVVEEMEAAGAVAAPTARDVAADCDVVITVLPNSSEVKEVVLGNNGVAEGARKKSCVIDMSSIAPQTSKEIAAALAARDVSFLDAPVSGGEPKAIAGTLAIMVGGPAAVLEEVKPILDAMGQAITHVGDVGSGNVVKLANQMIVALNIAAVAEALILATKAGVDPSRVHEAIRTGLAGSAVMEAKVPMMLARNFEPGFRIDLHIKDLNNALDAARSHQTAVPLSSQVLAYFVALQAAGKGASDHSRLIEYYENLS